jgi:hypothetical protein
VLHAALDRAVKGTVFLGLIKSLEWAAGNVEVTAGR